MFWDYLLTKQTNQCDSFDMKVLREMEFEILRSITHIMDCECYSVGKRQYLREISVYNVNNKQLFSLQVY